MLLLERERERNSQKIHGYIKGIGLASNAYHMTSPHPEGRGEKAAMEKALQNAALPKEKIDCVIAHGTGTKANDRIESIAIQLCLFCKVHAGAFHGGGKYARSDRRYAHDAERVSVADSQL